MVPPVRRPVSVSYHGESVFPGWDVGVDNHGFSPSTPEPSGSRSPQPLMPKDGDGHAVGRKTGPADWLMSHIPPLPAGAVPRPVVSQGRRRLSLQDSLLLEPADGRPPRRSPLFGPKEFVL